jgi:hypothetical protein
VDVCDCGRVVEQPRTGRRRSKCYVCRPVRDRPDRRAPVIQLPVPTRDPDEPGLADLTRKALDDAGVGGTWQAEACLALARLVDSGRHGASGPGGVIKSHRESMAFALQDSGTDADIITRIFSEG